MSKARRSNIDIEAVFWRHSSNRSISFNLLLPCEPRGIHERVVSDDGCSAAVDAD